MTPSIDEFTKKARSISVPIDEVDADYIVDGASYRLWKR